jgi:hypothetical protein
MAGIQYCKQKMTQKNTCNTREGAFCDWFEIRACLCADSFDDLVLIYLQPHATQCITPSLFLFICTKHISSNEIAGRHANNAADVDGWVCRFPSLARSGRKISRWWPFSSSCSFPSESPSYLPPPSRQRPLRHRRHPSVTPESDTSISYCLGVTTGIDNNTDVDSSKA